MPIRGIEYKPVDTVNYYLDTCPKCGGSNYEVIDTKDEEGNEDCSCPDCGFGEIRKKKDKRVKNE